ncbi:MAG: CpsD/CapB family tyrosine-protein kinase, partial [Planctomycetota bacterium]
FLGGLLCVAVEASDVRLVWTPSDVRSALGQPTIGFVPNAEDEVVGFRETCQAAAKRPHGSMAEAARKIGVRLWADRGEEEGGVMVLVTSCTPAEGKTTVLSNVAVTLAQSGHKVVVVDADLRKPSLHLIYDLPLEKGLADYLDGETTAEAIIKPTGVEGVYVVTSGRVEMSPYTVTELDRFRGLMTTLRGQADVVLVDTSPILGVSEVGLLARAMDEVILVVESGKVRKTVAARAMEMLRELNVKITGVVLSNVRYSKGDYFYYARYYGTR